MVTGNSVRASPRYFHIIMYTCTVHLPTVYHGLLVPILYNKINIHKVVFEFMVDRCIWETIAQSKLKQLFIINKIKAGLTGILQKA